MNRFKDIEKWAADRNIIRGSGAQAQMLKMTEEVGELAHAIARQNMSELKDALGDCCVVLTILAAQHDFNIEDCIEEAWISIKDRKGRMEKGIFIKEGE